MRISLLLQREPFGIIFQETLSAFLASWTGCQYEVRWQSGRPNPKAMRRQGQQLWLCNAYLGAIFVPEVSEKVFDPIRREYHRSVVWWRRPIQRVYVSMATSYPYARYLAHAGISLSPPIPNAKELLIIGGNHKIRLIDYAQGVVYSILKKGFPRQFIQREIEVRLQAEEIGLPVPTLEALGEDESWFAEQYLAGTPVNRLNDRSVMRRALADAARSLHRLLERTQREQFLEEYTENLRLQIIRLVETGCLLSDVNKGALLRNVDLIMSQINALCSARGCYQITTAITHGDFQPANILLNEDGVWLIDWEYSAQRQAGYDALVFASQSRFPRGLVMRLQQMQDGNCEWSWLLDRWLGLNWDNPSWRQIHSLIFLLEELALRLEENANPWFKREDKGLTILLEEIGRWIVGSL